MNQPGAYAHQGYHQPHPASRNQQQWQGDAAGPSPNQNYISPLGQPASNAYMGSQAQHYNATPSNFGSQYTPGAQLVSQGSPYGNQPPAVVPAQQQQYTNTAHCGNPSMPASGAYHQDPGYSLHVQNPQPGYPPTGAADMAYQAMPAAFPPPPPALNATDENGLRWTWSAFPSAAALLAADSTESPKTNAASIESAPTTTTGNIRQSASEIIAKAGKIGRREKNSFFPTAPEMVVPLGCMYEPLRPLNDPVAATTAQSFDGLICRQCGAFCSLFGIVDAENTWFCIGCRTKYPLPPVLTPEHPIRRFATVEFVLPPPASPQQQPMGYPAQPGPHQYPNAPLQQPAPPPAPVRDHLALIFVVDICIPVSELLALKQWLLESIETIPSDTLIGFITTGSSTKVWELGNQNFRRAYALRGNATLNHAGFSKALQVKATESSRGRFLVPLKECRPLLEQLLFDLEVDAQVVPSSQRPTRTSGTALSAATFLLEALTPLAGGPSGVIGTAVEPKDTVTPTIAPLPSAVTASQKTPGRIVMLSGGPCTRGGGAVASIKKEDLMRFHRDIVEGETPFLEPATTFYTSLAARLSYCNGCLDIFAQSFDQVGIMEMRSCVNHTGGYMICGDAFEHENFRYSWRRYLLRIGLCQPETMLAACVGRRVQSGELENDDEDLDKEDNEDWIYPNAGVSGVGVELEVICMSGDLTVAGVLGPCVPAAFSSASSKNKVKTAEHGTGNGSQRWFSSTMQMDTSLGIIFDVSPSAIPASSPAYSPQSNAAQFRYFQFITRYSTLSGERRVRVTSARLVVSPYGATPQYFASGATFDQSCAVALLARLAAYAMEKQPAQWAQVRRALDQLLIEFVRKFATFNIGFPDSVQLDASFSLFPVFVFHLRRSEYFMILNISPDESTFKRHWLLREPVDRALLMIQPTLYSYDLENPSATAVALDSESLKADNIVLMDAFFNMHIMWGSTIYEWIKARYHDNPEYEYFKNLLSVVEDDANTLLTSRFPQPRFSRTDANGSEARHIKTRVNPAHSYQGSREDPYAAGRVGMAGGKTVETADVINTDDTNIVKFMASLKNVVAVPEARATEKATGFKTLLKR